MATVSVDFNGPFFGSQRDVLVQRMFRDITREVTLETEQRVRILGQSMFRYADKSRHEVPGKWRSHMHAEFSGNEGIVDNDVVYGAWLEGVGSRNSSTRFKGYRMWRLTTQAMDRSGAREVAQPIVDRMIREMNG